MRRPPSERNKETAARPNRMNAISVISPYRRHGMWAFDDARVGLVQEPFVSGADTWIDGLLPGSPNAENGFTLIFSSVLFPVASIGSIGARPRSCNYFTFFAHSYAFMLPNAFRIRDCNR